MSGNTGNGVKRPFSAGPGEAEEEVLAEAATPSEPPKKRAVRFADEL
jgi:hypothetical protein